MTTEEKNLLLKDLCARLPYGVKVCSPDKTICSIWNIPTISVVTVINGSGQSSHPIKDIKPYLRPMSNMTEDEKKEFEEVLKSCNNKVFACSYKERRYNFFDAEQEDFMNAHHFDYRGLIPMGLALEAPEDMYKTE